MRLDKQIDDVEKTLKRVRIMLLEQEKEIEELKKRISILEKNERFRCKNGCVKQPCKGRHKIDAGEER